MFAARLQEKLIFSELRAVPRGWLGPNCEARNSTTQQMSGHAGCPAKYFLLNSFLVDLTVYFVYVWQKNSS